VLDIPNKNYVMSQAPGKFHMLPAPNTGASDEVLFANSDWLENNQESVQVLLEEVLSVWRSIIDDPSFVQEERERLGLLPDLPADLEKELVPYYEQAAEQKVFADDCGGEEAAKADFDFYHKAGQLDAGPEELQVEDFWDLGPMEAALESVEGSDS
jgi:NitT/TauT family transport system substrate-binding protein